MHVTSTNFECNIHKEVDIKSSNPCQQLILNATRPDFNATGEIWSKYLIRMHTSFIICLVQLIKNYGIVILNIPRCQQLHDCCI